MRNILFFFILSLITHSLWAESLKSEVSGINQKIKIDFTTSELTFDKTNMLKKSPMDKMKMIAQDHAKKNRSEITGIVLALHPIVENEKYSHFFLFNAKTNSLGSDGKVNSTEKIDINCLAFVNKDFNKYAAHCYHIKL